MLLSTICLYVQRVYNILNILVEFSFTIESFFSATDLPISLEVMMVVSMRNATHVLALIPLLFLRVSGSPAPQGAPPPPPPAPSAAEPVSCQSVGASRTPPSSDLIAMAFGVADQHQLGYGGGSGSTSPMDMTGGSTGMGPLGSGMGSVGSGMSDPTTNGGNQMTGSPLYRRQMTGNPMNGNPMTGNPMNGNPMSGNPVTGNSMIDNSMTGNPMTSGPMTGNANVDNSMNGDPMSGNPMTGSGMPSSGMGTPPPGGSGQIGSAGDPTGGLMSTGPTGTQTIQKTPFMQCTPGRPATGTVGRFCGALNGTAVQTDLFPLSKIGTYVLMWDTPVGGGCK